MKVEVTQEAINRAVANWDEGRKKGWIMANECVIAEAVRPLFPKAESVQVTSVSVIVRGQEDQFFGLPKEAQEITNLRPKLYKDVKPFSFDMEELPWPK